MVVALLLWLLLLRGLLLLVLLGVHVAGRAAAAPARLHVCMCGAATPSCQLRKQVRGACRTVHTRARTHTCTHRTVHACTEARMHACTQYTHTHYRMNACTHARMKHTAPALANGLRCPPSRDGAR